MFKGVALLLMPSKKNRKRGRPYMISDFLRPFLTPHPPFPISDHLRWSLIISDNLRLSLIISAYLRLSPIISDCLRLSPIVSDYLRLSPIISDCLRLSLIISDCLQLSLIISDYLRLSPIISNSRYPAQNMISDFSHSPPSPEKVFAYLGRYSMQATFWAN